MNEKKNEKEYVVETIRSQYTEKKYTELDELKALDKKVKKPAKIFASVFGTLSVLIMGSGMSLIMTDMGSKLGMSEPLFWGIVIGVIGLLMAILTYPLYKKLLNCRRKKYAETIIALSNHLLEQ